METLDREKFLQGRKPIACLKRDPYAKSKLETKDGPPPVNFILQKDVKVGDCTLYAGATFSYSVSGANGWFAKVSSTDTGDEFGVDVFLYNASNPCNNPLNETGLLDAVGHYQIDIHDANQIKNWQQIFGIGANLFSAGVGPLEVYTDATCVIIACAC